MKFLYGGSHCSSFNLINHSFFQTKEKKSSSFNSLFNQSMFLIEGAGRHAPGRQQSQTFHWNSFNNFHFFKEKWSCWALAPPKRKQINSSFLILKEKRRLIVALSSRAVNSIKSIPQFFKLIHKFINSWSGNWFFLN